MNLAYVMGRNVTGVQGCNVCPTTISIREILLGATKWPTAGSLHMT